MLGGYRYQSIRTGLVGHWRPSRGPTGNTLINSVRGNHGTLTNSPTWVASSGGYAIQTNGTNSSVVADRALADGASAFSYSCWQFKATTASNAGVGFSNGTSGGGARFSYIWLGTTIYTAAENGTGSFHTQTLSRSGWTHICVTFDGTLSTATERLKVYSDGTLVTGGTLASSPTTLGTVGAFRIGADATNRWVAGVYDDACAWGRVLNPSEIRAFYQAGRGALDQRVNVTVVRGATTGPTNYTLTAASGSFTLTGQAANLLDNRLVTADNGSFALSGQSANLLVGRTVTADSGSYTLTGQDANLVKTGSYSLTAESGSFTLSGQSANLLKNSVLAAVNGSYTVTGQDAVTLASRRLTAANGSYVLSGQSADLSYSAGAVAIDGSPYAPWYIQNTEAW